LARFITCDSFLFQFRRHQASSHVEQCYAREALLPLFRTASLAVEPFVINDNSVGFFVASLDFKTDIMSIVVLNLSDERVYLQDVEPPSGS
ncbi:hypothetical protein PMAYCL1PPCAC_23133, partial [Pristionchus mayeri]